MHIRINIRINVIACCSSMGKIRNQSSHQVVFLHFKKIKLLEDFTLGRLSVLESTGLPVGPAYRYKEETIIYM